MADPPPPPFGPHQREMLDPPPPPAPDQLEQLQGALEQLDMVEEAYLVRDRVTPESGEPFETVGLMFVLREVPVTPDDHSRAALREIVSRIHPLVRELDLDIRHFGFAAEAGLQAVRQHGLGVFHRHQNPNS